MSNWQTIVKETVYRHLATKELSPAAALVVLKHMDFADWMTGRNAYPTMARVGRECGFDERTVRRALERAEELGIIMQVKRGGGSGGSARGNTYEYVAHLDSGQPGPEFPTSDSTPDTTPDTAPDRTSGRADPRPSIPGGPTKSPDQHSQKKKVRKPKNRSKASRATPEVLTTTNDIRTRLRDRKAGQQ